MDERSARVGDDVRGEGTGPIRVEEPTPRSVPAADASSGGPLDSGGVDDAPTPSRGLLRSPGAPQQDRQGHVALFLVHMFPIGHLPVPSAKPARQLPIPPEDADYAAGLRFPPHDHPESALISSEHALTALRDGARVPQAPPAEVLPPPPAELSSGYDPLAGDSAYGWERRYIARADVEAPEYAWPPGEVYPEGGCAAGEPVVLAVGTLLDRFGTAAGRVFAADGTPLPERSLPPNQLSSGYRRYRVVREVPMWLAHTAGWFGQPGGGLRYRAVYSAAELVTLGYLADVTFAEQEHRERSRG